MAVEGSDASFSYYKEVRQKRGKIDGNKAITV